MSVVGADSIDTALQAMDAHHIDVIVSDIGLVEDDDGLTLIRAVRARAPERGRNTPAVAVTAYASPEDRTRVTAAGYQRHVAKPVEPDALIAAVAAVVGRREPS
jgi:CheY-like chemotaxis protein